MHSAWQCSDDAEKFDKDFQSTTKHRQASRNSGALSGLGALFEILFLAAPAPAQPSVFFIFDAALT